MHPLAISNDITVGLSAPVSLHMYQGLQGFVPAAPSLDIPVPMYWPPGFALGSNKLTTTVLHKDMPVVLDGHDCGTSIGHVQIAPDPANALSVIHILFSSRKVKFFTSDKVANKQCIGVVKLLAWPPAPMTSCGEPVSVPGAGAPTTALNSALVDLSLVDALIGWGAVAAELALDFVLLHLSKVSPKSPADQMVNLMKNKVGIGDRALGKQAIAALSGAARLALTDGPANFQPTVGSPYLGFGLGVSRNDDGEYSVSAKAGALHWGGEVGKDQGSYYAKSEQRSSDDVITVEQRPGQKPDYGYQKLSTKLDSWGRPL
jgi:hypothetical protein